MDRLRQMVAERRDSLFCVSTEIEPLFGESQAPLYILRNQIKAMYLKSVSEWIKSVDKACSELSGLHSTQHKQEDEEVEYIRTNLSVHISSSLMKDAPHSVVEVILSLQRSLLPPRVCLLKEVLRAQRDAIAAISSLSATDELHFEEEATTLAPYVQLVAQERPIQLERDLARNDVHLRDLAVAFESAGSARLGDARIVWSWINRFRAEVQEAATSSLNVLRRVLCCTWENEDVFSGLCVRSADDEAVSAALRKPDACRVLHPPEHLANQSPLALLVDEPTGVACRAARIFAVVYEVAARGGLPEDTISGQMLGSIVFRATVMREPVRATESDARASAPVSPTGSSVSRAASSVSHQSRFGCHLVRQGLGAPSELELLECLLNGMSDLACENNCSMNVELHVVRESAAAFARTDRSRFNNVLPALEELGKQKSTHLQLGRLLRELCDAVDDPGCSYLTPRGRLPSFCCSNKQALVALRGKLAHFLEEMKHSAFDFLQSWTNHNKERIRQLRRMSVKRARDAS